MPRDSTAHFNPGLLITLVSHLRYPDWGGGVHRNRRSDWTAN